MSTLPVLLATESETQQGIQLNTTVVLPYIKGLVKYNSIAGLMSHGTDCGFDLNAGSTVSRFYNDTGVTILAGTPVTVGTGETNDLPHALPADANNPLHVLGYIGITPTAILPTGEGIAILHGGLLNQDTTSVPATGTIYLKAGGGITQTRPLFPIGRLILGGVLKRDALTGVIGAKSLLLTRKALSRNIAFTSTGSGVNWEAGFYNWATTNAALTEASPTQLFGSSGQTYGAHFSIVAEGAGSVTGGGQVGLKVTGVRDDESGTQVLDYESIITEDITTLVGNTYYETDEKFSSECTMELYVVSGTPTAYSLNCNYGFSKYEDMEDTDWTLTTLDCKWLAGSNDSGFDVALYHHKSTNWTYAATGFTPGDGDICRRSVDQAIAGNVVSGQEGAYKRTGLNIFINGRNNEGVILQITTTAPGTMEILNTTISGVSEEV